MTSAMWLFLAGLTSIIGMAYLAMSIKRHWHQVFDESVSPYINRIRVAGWLFILISVIACFKADHPSMAVLVWVTLLSPAALVVALALTIRPQVFKYICFPFLKH